jgi:hypothetical protein
VAPSQIATLNVLTGQSEVTRENLKTSRAVSTKGEMTGSSPEPTREADNIPHWPRRIGLPPHDARHGW